MLKQLFIITLFLWLSPVVSAHEFYFAFAEIELNEMNGTIETTIVATTHDIEKELRFDKAEIQQIPGNENNTSLLLIIENKINEGLKIQMNGVQQKLHLEGIEVQLNGVVNLFLSGSLAEIPNQFDVYFGFLMKTFTGQQNKMTLIYREKKKSFVFLQNLQTQTINLIDEK